jgi:YD repeat-containing protein
VTYHHDAANRVLTRRVDPLGLNLVTTYQYDAKGQRISTTDPNGVITTAEFDRKGQVLKQTVSVLPRASYVYRDCRFRPTGSTVCFST